MADTYDWIVETLDSVIETGVVYTVHWRVSSSRIVGTGEEQKTYTSGAYGTESYTADPEDPSFIAYDDLTEEICIEWVKSSMGEDGVAALEARLTEDLDEQEAPTKETGVPWSE